MRRALAIAALLLAAGPALAGSTINPSVPAANSPLNSAPIRGNFLAAYTDVNNILGMYAGSTAPVSPTQGQDWLNTTTPGAATWSKWDATTSTWVLLGTFNLTTGTFSPNITNLMCTVSQGCTGQTTLTAHGVLVGEGTSPVGQTAAGAVGTVLVGQGSGADPSFQALIAGNGILVNNTGGTITVSLNGAVSTANGGCGVALSPAAGGVLYSTALGCAVLPPPLGVGALFGTSLGTPYWATQQQALNSIAPTPTRAGDVIYWNGTNWTNLPGNNSGTGVLTESPTGNPSWASATTGTTAGCAAGLADGSGAGLTFTNVSCTYTTTPTNSTNIVNLNFELTYPVTANSSASQINGLPVAPANAGYGDVACAAHTGSSQPIFFITKNTTHGTLIAIGGTVATNVNLSGLTVSISCTYTTS